MDDHRLRVCLERTIELAEVRLRLRDWPGLAGPIVHVPDPLSADESFVEAIAATMAQRYRVLSLRPRGASPYQVDAADLLAMLDQFGFATPVLVAERLGCVAALLVAAWHADGRVAGLVLIDPTYDPPRSDGMEARASEIARPTGRRCARRSSAPSWNVPRSLSRRRGGTNRTGLQLAPVVT